MKLEKPQAGNKGVSRNHQTQLRMQSLAQTGRAFLMKSAYFQQKYQNSKTV